MTHRYITKVYWGSELEREIPTPTSITIFEDDDNPIDTGLLDGHGNTIYRVRTKNKTGFQVQAVKKR